MPAIEQQKLSDIQLADSGSYEPASLFGDFISLFERLWIPPLGEAGANGDHSQQFLDMIWSLSQIFANACQIQVCREATDGDTQYSVTAGKVHVAGTLVSYAGAANNGPLTAGSDNYVYATFSDPTTLVIANATTGWPTTQLHLKLAIISQPASGPWRAEHIVRYLGSHAARVDGPGALYFSQEVAFNYNTSSPIALGYVPAGARIFEAGVAVGTTFDGGFAGSIGDAGLATRNLVTGDVTWGTLGGYTARKHYRYTAGTLVNLYLTPGAATQGAGRAWFSWRM